MKDNLWDRLIALAKNDIAREIRERIIALGEDVTEEEIKTEFAKGQEEALLRLEEATAVVKEKIPEEDKTKRIFKIMLGNLYEGYMRDYKETTGQDW